MRKILLLSLLLCVSLHADERPTAPDKIVALTFDDSIISHATFVAPLLKKLGFGATFFITEGFEFTTDKARYMTWEQIKALHTQGFEIGNHTLNHRGVNSQKRDALVADIAAIETRCEEHGIPRPTSFCYPGYATSPLAVDVLRERGYRLARAGGKRAFDPKKDEPLLAPQAFDSKPGSDFEGFKAAVATAKDGKIPILTFHGVPDMPHPWVNTTPELFTQYMTYLKDQGYSVVALRELGKYLD
ncbi:MAG: peptidoglycan/xylan/chitin deacetylase (PgdA/CDA1 family) [Rhodothermales bacterium]|jgi:peptidoglycan/xylan/chitin deacetylase (PgdA/CDA1 family)